MTATICEFCRDAPAGDVPYVRQGRSLAACPACLDRYTVQSALEDRIQEVFEHAGNGDLPAAFAIFDQLLATWSHRDQSRYLARSVASFRLLLLREEGQLDQAHEAAVAREALGFHDAEDEMLHRSEMACLFEQSDRPAEALTAMEAGLDLATDEKTLPRALHIFRRYVSIAGPAGETALRPREPLIRQTLAAWGVEPPTDAGAWNDTRRIILDADAAVREGGARYHAFLATLKGMDEAERRAAITTFADTEPIGMYAKLARHGLEAKADVDEEE